MLLIVTAADTDVAQISAAACSALEKLLSEFPRFFPSIVFHLSSVKSQPSSLIAELGRGLSRILAGRQYRSCLTKPYASLAVCWFVYFDYCQKCSDTVGWVMGRSSGLYNVGSDDLTGALHVVYLQLSPLTTFITLSSNPE